MIRSGGWFVNAVVFKEIRNSSFSTLLFEEFCLTLSGLGFFENLRVGRGPSRPAVKKHAVSQKIFVHFTWNFVHILYWQYGISLDKKNWQMSLLSSFAGHHLYFYHHDNHVLTFFKFSRNWCISFCYKWNLEGNFIFFV